MATMLSFTDIIGYTKCCHVPSDVSSRMYDTFDNISEHFFINSKLIKSFTTVKSWFNKFSRGRLTDENREGLLQSVSENIDDL